MNKRLALSLYLALWVAIAAAVIGGIVGAGYPLWTAVVSACLLFVFLNGSLAYGFRARRLRLEGKNPPPYLRYLFLPNGIPRFTEAAPRSTHVLVGIAAALTGAFFLFCGAALAFDAQWSLIPHPIIAAAMCLALAGIGAAFLYLALRLFAFWRRPSDAT